MSSYERRNFSETDILIRFHALGRRCECTGCTAGLFGHVERCSATFAYADRSPEGSTSGWHADHANGDASDNRAANLRILCVPCHEKTPSYGRGLASLTDSLARALGPKVNAATFPRVQPTGPMPAPRPRPGSSLARALEPLLRQQTAPSLLRALGVEKPPGTSSLGLRGLGLPPRDR